MTIDQIIAHELLGIRAVSLPYVGTLYAHRVPVHRSQTTEQNSSDIRLLPPGVEVSLDGAFYDDRSIIVLLQAYFAELDQEAATLLYNRWVEEASANEPSTLVVQGVCRISTVDFSLSIDPATTALLHTGRTLSLSDTTPQQTAPSPDTPMQRPKARLHKVRVWPAVAGLGVAMGYILFTLLA